MNTRTIRSALTMLVALFTLSYSIYIAIRFFYSPYQTETAFEYTVSDDTRAKAVALRDERLVEASVEGVLSYVCADGEVVTPGTVVAEAHVSADDLRNRAIATQAENEIALLRRAQSTSNAMPGNEMLVGQINETMGLMTASVAQGDLTGLPGQRERLQELLARRQVIMGNGGGFSERLAYLENRKANALSHVSNIKARVTAPVGGYFCSIIDGYENLLTIRDFTTLSVDDYRRAAGGLMEPTPTGNAIGRVQIGHNWYLAALVDDGISNRFTPGGSVSLDFGVADSREIPVRIAQVLRDPASASGQAVVILQCNRINPHLISLRRATVDIRFASYTGLRINPAAIRFDGETEGVYVLEGRRIAFKKIERIYETENYVLCKIVMPSASEPIAPLKLFDEVIVEGVDLYDGKIV